jgi:hypothetical protein
MGEVSSAEEESGRIIWRTISASTALAIPEYFGIEDATCCGISSARISGQQNPCDCRGRAVHSESLETKKTTGHLECLRGNLS